MTTAADAPAVPQEAFDLQEAISLEESAFQSDGTVELHIIRPCVGQGKGHHVYSPEMLSENAHKFTGWRMYVDHQSEAARRAAAGLPRSVRDLGGRVLEAKWDAEVAADPEKGYEKGAVVGTIRPVGVVRQLIEEDPGLLEASINARASSVRPVTRNGRRAWLVEGIESRGSVDFVTEGGAGGRVAHALMEAYHDANDEERAVLESLTDNELLDQIKQERPQLLEAIKSDATTSGEAGKTPTGGDAAGDPGGDMTATPAEMLREALDTDEGREAVTALFTTQLEEARSELEDKFREEAELARAEARADADRAIQVRDLRDKAHAQIKEAKLPEAFEENLLESFDLDGREPKPALNVFDEVDPDTGDVVKPASSALREAVTEAVGGQRRLIEAAGGGTKVRGQGAGEGEGDGKKPPADGDKDSDQPLWKQTLQEAGYEEPTEVYADVR